MGIGPQIKEYRIKKGLTQKELSDRLHVTYQAVSRWENDDAEPSFDMLKELCALLDCTTDDLFDIKKKTDENPPIQQERAVEKVIVQESRPVLGVCEQCNCPIFDAAELQRVTERIYHGHASETRQKILCSKCNEERLQREKKEAEYRKLQEKREFRNRRIHSFVWPGILAAVFVALGTYFFVTKKVDAGCGSLVLALLSYTFAATMILDNTALNDIWFGITSWGIKFPGIIFSFSLDGLLFLIAVKALFFLIGALISVLGFIFATALSLVLSIFFYPFALIKNLRCED